MVLATQNPVELKGTFPLPEAQVDRFLLRLRMGYPSHDEETLMLERFRRGDPLAEVRAVAVAESLPAARAAVRAVHVADDVARYIVAVTQATRESAAAEARCEPARLALPAACRAGRRRSRRARLRHPRRRAGSSSRRSLRTVCCSPAMRLIDGRDPDDVLREIVAAVPVPAEAARGRSSRHLIRRRGRATEIDRLGRPRRADGGGAAALRRPGVRDPGRLGPRGPRRHDAPPRVRCLRL